MKLGVVGRLGYTFGLAQTHGAACQTAPSKDHALLQGEQWSPHIAAVPVDCSTGETMEDPNKKICLIDSIKHASVRTAQIV